MTTPPAHDSASADASTSPPPAPSPRRTDPRLTAAIVASALFMQNLDSTAVMTALPAMARELGEEPARLGAAITAYLVALTVFIPLSGWVADRFGAKRVFMLAIVLFTIASVLCGRATGLAELVAARVLQGLGGAMMLPVARLLLLRQVRKDEILTAMTWLTMPALIGPIMGPPLGGLLTDTLGWRSVFLINLPIGVLGLVMVAWRIAPAPVAPPGPPDVAGLALTGAALALVMFGLETVGRGITPPLVSEATLAAGLLTGWVAVRHCRRVVRPAVDFALLRIPSFWQAAGPGTLFRIGAGATPFLIPTLLQIGFGHSASEAGLVSFATALGALAMKPLARPVLRRFGFRATITVCCVLAAASIALSASFTAAWPLWSVFLVLALSGLLRSLQFTAISALAFADVPAERFSAATGFFATLQQLAPALGVVLATATLEASAALAGRPHGTLATADFALAFLVAGALALAAAPFFARMAPDAGADVSGHGVGVRRRRGA